MGFQHSEVLGQKPSEFGIEESRAYVYSLFSPRLDQLGFARQIPVSLINKDGRLLESFLDIQICRTASCYAVGAWYDRDLPIQLERASWTMRILARLSRLQHEFELFWPAHIGCSSATGQSPRENYSFSQPAVDREASAPNPVLSVDLEYHRVTIGDKPVRLTAREWNILQVLVKNVGRVIGPRQLLQEAWGPEYSNEFDYVRAYIRRLRKKLESDPKNPRHILLERGIGYRLVLQA